jgi:predicted NBD/HSP70 family sugar kinase
MDASRTLEAERAATHAERRRSAGRFAGHEPPEYAIGLNAAVLTIAGGVVELDTGRVVRRIEVPTPSDEMTILEVCLDIAAELASSQRVHHIGIAVPEIVDRKGAIQSCATWDWLGVDVAARLGAVAPTLVQSDVRAAAYAEAHVGAGDGLECFVYVMIAAGISAVIVRHGIPWAGRCGAALVLGVPPVEEVAGAQALAGLSGTTAEDALVTPGCAAAVAEAAGRLGSEMARVVNLIDPDAVIVGGPLGLNPSYRRQWVEAMRSSVWYRPSSLVPVVPAELRSDAELVGAALATTSLLPT